MGAALSRCCDPELEANTTEKNADKHPTTSISNKHDADESIFWDESAIASTGEGSSLNTSDLHFDSKARRHFSDLNEYDSYFYPLPIDDIEAKRLGFQHQVMRSILRTNFTVPLKIPLEEGIKVLDVGTGPATWIIDMAKQFPNSEFEGCDVNDYAPPEGRTFPPNCQFKLGNVITGLPYADDSFDYVHQRFLVAAIPRPFWQQVVRELTRVTKPGGYVELIEDGVDGFLVDPTGPAIARAIERLRDVSVAGTMGRRGRQKAQAYTWTRAIDHLERALKSA